MGIWDWLAGIPVNANLRVQLAQLHEENTALKAQVDVLKKRCADCEKQRDELQGRGAAKADSLSEDLEALLQFLSLHIDWKTEDIAYEFELSVEAARFRLVRLRDEGLIAPEWSPFEDEIWRITQAGREYLHARKMLK